MVLFVQKCIARIICHLLWVHVIKNHVKYLNSVDTADDMFVHVMQLICINFELFYLH